MKRAVLAWLAVLLVVMGATGIWLGVKYAGAVHRSGSQAEVDLAYLSAPPDAAQKFLKEFTLTDEAGRTLQSQDLRGKVYVTNFFFSTCPGTCLQQNQKIQEIQRQYGPKGVRFLSITCDPETDDPGRLRQYALKLDADRKHWSFLTGQLLYIRRVAGEIYQVALNEKTHSERFFVTDKWGRIRGNFEWNKLDQITEMRLLLDKLLAETEPEDRGQEAGVRSQATEDRGTES
jgi:cytochrome oxidase Cu insertion factor (SCO1/SenC/PrrC family)